MQIAPNTLKCRIEPDAGSWLRFSGASALGRSRRCERVEGTDDAYQLHCWTLPGRKLPWCKSGPGERLS